MPKAILDALGLPTQAHFVQPDYSAKDPMRFTLIDRITELEPGVRITAVKNLTMAEEYLGDHFPHFPVMPGVLMLEAMTQAAAWLIRATEDFAHSTVVLKEVANVKYGRFVEPGETLTVTAEIISDGQAETKLKAQGSVGGQTTVSGRLLLAKYNLGDTQPDGGAADRVTEKELRRLFALLYQPEAAVS
jgi:3-hydroxyacyl-[acyl-carrier-protein] dehydratase